MNIKIVIIDKGGKDRLYDPLIEHLIKSSKKFANIEIVELFDKSITRAHEEGSESAKKAYTKILEPYLEENSVKIALNPTSKIIDSFDMAKVLKDKASIIFFIGGPYGFEKGFIDKSNYSISFGKITLSHKIAKVVLLEQIFRGLSINNNHPYHK
jgi:23S rRNA (pseudouridine1915-N3)-methyltransferase